MLGGCRGLAFAVRSALQLPQIASVPRRHIAARRRFYRSVGVVGADDLYEVSLDQRKLKTPSGRLLQVPSRQLALAVAHEWESCAETVEMSLMHLTGLCFTVLDNPYHRSRDHLVNKIAGYLDSDTVLFPVELPAELAETQQREWGTVLDWFRSRYDVIIESAAANSLTANVPAETLEAVKTYLNSHDVWTLTGLLFAIEAVRSTVLPLAALERKLTPEEVVRLSKLESDYQAQVWGRVEWAHDVDKFDTEARVSAGLLMAQLSCATCYTSRQKRRAYDRG